MYGGIGGAVGYAGGSIARGAGKVVKGAGRMLGNITGINARMQRHKEARAEKKNMNAQVKIAKKEAKDASRLAQGGSYNPTSTPKNAQQAGKMADKSIRSALSADKKVANIEKGIAKAVAQNQKISEKYAKKYGSAGAQVSNVLNRDRLNKINQSVERLKRAGRETDISAIMARRGKGGKK